MSKKSNFSTSERDKIEFNQLNEKAKNKAYLDSKLTKARQMESLNTGMSLFGLIVALLLGVAVIRVLAGYEGLSFASLLEALANAPNIQMSLSSSMQLVHIGGEWEILDGIRRFINSLGSMFGISIWCAQGLFQCILYFGYFIGFIFVG